MDLAPIIQKPHGAALPLLHCIPDDLHLLGICALPLQEAAAQAWKPHALKNTPLSCSSPTAKPKQAS